MRRMLVFLGLLVFPAGLVAGNHGLSVSTVDGAGEITDCSQLRATFDDQPAVTATETVPISASRSLVVRAPRNGGIWVAGSDSATFEVRACKAAALAETLGAIRTQVRGDAVSAEGPDGGDWVVYFLVRAPRNGSVDLRTTNGPISIRSVNGSVTAHALNGPISLRETSGDLQIETTNGPISLDGGSGAAKLSAENGPISVRLRGTQWDGTLDAHAENGPVSLHVPPGFITGVVLQSNGHGPVSCRAEACRDARRTWSDDDDSRRIELGSGPVAVHLSTVNGPVSVKD